jgi:hypothetical protein
MHPEEEEVSETEEARVERRVEAIRGLYSSDHDELMLATIRADIAVADEEQAEIVRARNAAMRQRDEERRAKEGNIRALNAAIERAEKAEAEVERLTRELQTMDHFAEVSEQVERASNAAHARAEAAEAEVERLTRECLDREATETDARERLRQAEERLAAMEALHVKSSDGLRCLGCLFIWPCPTISELR